MKQFLSLDEARLKGAGLGSQNPPSDLGRGIFPDGEGGRGVASIKSGIALFSSFPMLWAATSKILLPGVFQMRVVFHAPFVLFRCGPCRTGWQGSAPPPLAEYVGAFPRVAARAAIAKVPRIRSSPSAAVKRSMAWGAAVAGRQKLGHAAVKSGLYCRTRRRRGISAANRRLSGWAAGSGSAPPLR